jgi:hypothetical protein
VSFGTSPTSAPYASFDNSAGGSGIVLTVLSAVGVNGAYLTASGNEIGSPASVVPEPGTWAMLLAGAGIVAGAVRRRRAA